MSSKLALARKQLVATRNPGTHIPGRKRGSIHRRYPMHNYMQRVGTGKTGRPRLAVKRATAPDPHRRTGGRRY